eukprot:scaffold13670_cov28-Attheya_sp.AAC.1
MVVAPEQVALDNHFPLAVIIHPYGVMDGSLECGSSPSFFKLEGTTHPLRDTTARTQECSLLQIVDDLLY